MKKNSFTLMELLIVTGIILTLVSLILSLVHLGINAARKIQCINNLRQIYNATRLYEEEYGSPPFLAKHFVIWNPELKLIMICPSDPYQGYGDIAARSKNYEEKAKDYPNFVPFSYEPIYWTWYWMLRIKPHFGRFGEENEWWEKDWEETVKVIRQKINEPDTPVIFCPFHNLAIFRDGNVRKFIPKIVIRSISSFEK